MKIIFLIGFLMLAGCATQPVFKWSSGAGKKCYYTCKSDSSVCSSKCTSIFCFKTCGDSETFCMQACPDVQDVALKGE